MRYKIEYVGHGIANRFPQGLIRIHKKLLQPKFQPLFLEILDHEKKHTDVGYTIDDFKLDMKGFRNKSLYRYFVLTTPSSWIQFSPMLRANGIWYFDMTLMMSYGVAFLIILLILFFYHNHVYI